MAKRRKNLHNEKNKSLRTDKLISKYYFNPKHTSGFSSKEKLKNALQGRVSSKEVSRWLNKTDSYTLHKPTRRKFSRRKYIVSGINAQWQVDLTDLPQLAKYNEGYRYILLVIDTFSRKAYAKPLRTKSGISVSGALEGMISSENKPDEILSDRGKEFFNSHFKQLMRKYRINHYSSNNQEIKASIVERLQRTVKNKMFKVFTHRNSYKYIDILDDIIQGYNESIHSTHGVKPNAVNYQNQETIWQRLYNPDNSTISSTRYKFKIGDKVRISKYSTIFAKGYLPSWSQEIFTVVNAHRTSPPVYSLRDDNFEELEGTWYSEEMQKIDISDQTYKIESIVGKRKVNGKIQYLVRWAGYSPNFDSYINKSDLLLNYNN